MPAVSNIVINDGAATPVSHTFAPLGQDAKGVWWFEQTAPVPVNALAAKRIGVKVVRTMDANNKLDTTSTCTITVRYPALVTLGTNDAGFTPPPSLAYTTKARLEFTIPDRGTAQERKDVRSFLYNLLGATSPLVTCIDNANPLY